MLVRIRNASRDYALGEFRLCESYFARLKGLLATKHDAQAVMLYPCWSIHSIGMQYALDVCFINATGKVLLSQKNWGVNKKLQVKGSRFVLERPSSCERWPLAGDQLLCSPQTERDWKC